MSVHHRTRSWLSPALCLVTCLALVMSPRAQTNVLMIIADDLGVDLVGAYEEHPVPARTPVIDGLARAGVLFRNVWANPSCSPARATMLTGRYAHRTGVGFAFAFSGFPGEMPASELTLAEVLAPTHETFMVGKWHLASASQSGYLHPLLEGFDTHLGPIANLSGGLVGDAYFDYEKVVDGVPSQSTTYATTEQVDDAIALMQGASAPWFLCLAFSAPHAPVHAPPPALHSYNLPPDVSQDIPMAVRAMVEAMDTEIGRLLDGIPFAQVDDTLVIFVGDNGTSTAATTAPFVPAQSKGTVYEGGIGVPLIVAGPGVVAGGECEALVNTTDLFATVADVAGVATSAEDSVSLVPYFSDPDRPPLRDWIYAELFAPNGPGPGPFLARQRAARGQRFKLVQTWEGPAGPVALELFDLDADPFESTDLLAGGGLSPAQAHAQSQLLTVLGDLDEHDPWTSLGGSLANTLGVAPVMVGGGGLAPGTSTALLIADAHPDTLVALVVGTSAASVPLKGGTLVPFPDVIFALASDELGNVLVNVPWPADVPPGVDTWWQAWVFDPAGPQEFTATEALFKTTQ